MRRREAGVGVDSVNPSRAVGGDARARATTTINRQRSDKTRPILPAKSLRRSSASAERRRENARRVTCRV